MLDALRRGDLLEPSRRAPLILRQLWRESDEVAFLWRARYNLPDTDPRFLAQTEETMARDLLQHAYLAVRQRQEDPKDPLIAELRERSRDARRAILALGKDTSKFDASVRRHQERSRAPRPLTLVRVITESSVGPIVPEEEPHGE